MNVEERYKGKERRAAKDPVIGPLCRTTFAREHVAGRRRKINGVNSPQPILWCIEMMCEKNKLMYRLKGLGIAKLVIDLIFRFTLAGHRDVPRSPNVAHS